MRIGIFLTLVVGLTVAAKREVSLPWPSINETSLRTLVIDSTTPLAVLVHRGGGSRKQVDTLRKFVDTTVTPAARALEGLVPFATLDVTSEVGMELQRVYNFFSIPSVALFNSDLDQIKSTPDGKPAGKAGNVLYMKVPRIFGGDIDTSAEGLTRWIVGNLSTRVVRFLQSPHDVSVFLASLDATVVRSKMPKVMLFLKHGEPPSPSFVALAQEMRYRAMWAVVAATDANERENVAGGFNVTVRPSLVALRPMEPSGEEGTGATASGAHTPHRLQTFPLFRAPTPAEQRPGLGRVFQGHAAIRTFLEAHVLNATQSAEVREAMMYLYSTMFETLAEAERAARAPKPLIEIASDEEWKRVCAKRSNGHCLVVFVDASLGGEPPLTVDDMSALAKEWQRRRETPLQFVVVDGLANREMASALGVVNGFPDAVVIHPGKQRYARLQAALSRRGVGKWLEAIGTWRWATLPNLPPLNPLVGQSSSGNGEGEEEL